MNKIHLDENDIASYKEILGRIQVLLRGRADERYIVKLLGLLSSSELVDFYVAINSSAVWGGWGVLVDPYLGDKAKDTLFDQEKLNLISLMERTNFAAQPALDIKNMLIRYQGKKKILVQQFTDNVHLTETDVFSFKEILLRMQQLINNDLFIEKLQNHWIKMS